MFEPSEEDLIHSVFKFTDIPKGRVLSADEVDGYARKLLGEMTLQEEPK